MKRRPALTKNEMRPTTSPKCFRLHLAGGLHGVEHRDRGRERVGQFLHRRRARLLQVVRAHVHRIPLRQLGRREQDRVLDEPHRRRGRKHVGAAREIFLHDVVLRRALQLGARRALLVGHRDVEREQPGGRRVDGHRGVHLVERDLRRTARACRRDGRSARRPCRLRRWRGRGRSRSRSGSADRRRPKGRSGPWRGSCGRARSTRARSNAPNRCGKSRACRVAVASVMAPVRRL